MSLTIITTIDAVPSTLTTDQVKAWLNIPTYQVDDDDMISTIIIPDVIDYVAKRTGVSYARRRHVVSVAMFSELDFEIVGAGHDNWQLSYYDAADDLQVLASDRYRVEIVGDRIIVTETGEGFPTIDSTRIAPVMIEFTTEAELAGTARMAVLSLCAARYANRGDDWSENLSKSVIGMLDTITPRRAHA